MTGTVPKGGKWAGKPVFEPGVPTAGQRSYANRLWETQMVDRGTCGGRPLGLEETRREVDAWKWSHDGAEQHKVRDEVVAAIWQQLHVKPTVDAFALESNARCPRHWGPDSKEITNALKANWQLEEMIWANPPFSLLSAVVKKAKSKPVHMLLTVPVWPDKSWYVELQDLIVVRCHIDTGSPIFLWRGVDYGPTKWPVDFLLICSHKPQCTWEMMQWRSLSKAQLRKRRRRRVMQRWDIDHGGGQ